MKYNFIYTFFKSKKSFSFFTAIAIFFILCTSFSFAQNLATQKMTLLAVSEGATANQSFGATATVTLEVLEGSGRIFINTYPFAKIDTQVSVRLANEVACDFLNVDCNSYDFIYSIETGSSTIGGPSAGAALAALTVATLDGQKIDTKATISGTINSGGVVGAVGGLKEKLEAAADLGLTKVLIPLGERYIADSLSSVDNVYFNTSNISNSNVSVEINDINNQSNQNEENTTEQSNNTNSDETQDNSSRNKIEISFPVKTDLIAYGKEKGVNVVETGTLAEVLFELTGKQYELPVAEVEPPEFYKMKMKNVADELCSRAQNLLDNLSVNVTFGNLRIELTNETQFPEDKQIILNGSNIDIVSTIATAKQLLNNSLSARDGESYYSAASYCYGAALNLRFLSFLNTTPQEAYILANGIVNSTNINLSQYRTITDLQTYMLVDERITEANERILDGKKLMEQNRSVLALNTFATAIERISSAKLWATFFSSPDNEINLNLGEIEESCKLKIQEATERQNLIGYYIDDADVGAQLLSVAQKQLGKNPVLCLFAASKAKASYDLVLSSMGLTKDVFNETFDKKSQIAARVISKQFASGSFPIIGYSYYEYAKSLANTDSSAALLYIQYALELSNLDAYLSTGKIAKGSLGNEYYSRLGRGEFFVIGISMGLILGITILRAEQYFRNKKLKSQKKTKIYTGFKFKPRHK